MVVLVSTHWHARSHIDAESDTIVCTLPPTLHATERLMPMVSATNSAVMLYYALAYIQPRLFAWAAVCAAGFSLAVQLYMNHYSLCCW